MRRYTPPAAMRAWLAWAGIVATIVLVASACRPPPHAAVKNCTAMAMQPHAEGNCTVTVERFARRTSTRIKVDSPKPRARLSGHFTVQHGTVKVSLRGMTGIAAETALRPGALGPLEADVRLGRDPGFHLHFDREGEASGLAGTVQYRSR